ncbi:MAG: hypothetical protein J6P61_10040 [Erysipelotrichaceae bacterium]|nr:hypothetical protein [Erysipelotrichaceae bacterium]
MNQYIIDIVRIDHECQEKLAAVKKEKAGVNEHLTEKRQELYESFARDYTGTIEWKKAALQVQFDNAKAATRRDYELNLKRLEEVYSTNKDELVAQLVKRCLSDD